MLLVLTPVINFVLRLDNLLVAGLVCIAAVPMTVMGGQAGILQGERRWLPLSMVYVANGVPRLIIGFALIAWHPSELSAMLGVVATLGAWLLSGLALVFVGGKDYSEIQSQLWLFAVLGTVLAMLQLLVYSVLARQGQRSVYLVWAALVALVALGLTVSTVDGLLAVVLTIDLALLASRMLLQVHDELVFEVAEGEREKLDALVRAQMGGAAELTVPLDVSVGTGRSWHEAAH